MLITFKSKAAADILMYEIHAKRILDLLHKDLQRGVITAAETGSAIAILEAEIAESKAHPTEETGHEGHPSENDDDPAQACPPSVSFATRAYPFLDMLRAAYRGGHDIVWGIAS